MMDARDARDTGRTDVLVAGAGPTGLVLALWLRRLGVSVRVIDKAPEPGTTSRALAVHARTLELYRQVGIAEEVVERGLKFGGVNLWVRGAHVARAAFADIGVGLSPFPYAMTFPQDEHERLLIEHLRQAGVEVERRVSVTGSEDRGDRVRCHLVGPEGRTTEVDAAYLADCEGAHSALRESLHVGFPGGTYERLFYVADVDLRGRAADGELHVSLDEADLLAIFPVKGEGRGRLIGTLPPSATEGDRAIGWDDVSKGAVERLGITVARVNWFSTYRVHHRVAERFARGRVFLLGDAAHIHSPVGGQGMNTGIGDAVNLAWKLAAVLQGRAAPSLLATYEPERIAFAERLVATTDRAFTAVSRNGPLARAVRLEAVPRLLPALMLRAAFRRWVFRTVSQIAIHYRRSLLSEGHAGRVRAGDRLPWVAPEREGGEDNFTPLSALAWQAHVYGEPPAAVARTCERLGLPVHAFAWTTRTERAGLARNALYVVRPDGHVAFADEAANPAALDRYADRRSLRFA